MPRASLNPTARPVSDAPRNGAATRERILDAATDEFVVYGFSGARIDRIVSAAACNIRMIYHYFGNKEGLYVAALEKVYAEIREGEQALDLGSLAPLDAIHRLVDFTFDHFASQPSFVGMTQNENLVGGRYMARATRISAMSSPLMRTLKALLRQGAADGTFRSGIDAFQLYVSVVALSCHHLNNRHTLSVAFGVDMTSRRWLTQRRAHVREMILAAVLSPNLRMAP